MGRAPCCEKMGLKRGPWTPEEDKILIDHINSYGHSNWRALPKQAGLLRCGKSCRLRWINYLRPDIKRGNFTKEEEDEIINLHQMLGNRWSAIAARLPGRTDNEIKNIWHTHLKKRLPQAHNNIPKKNKKQTKLDFDLDASKSDQDTKQEQNNHDDDYRPQCSSDMSSHNNNSSIATNNNNNHDVFINNKDGVDSAQNNLALDEDFWSEVLSSDNSNTETSGGLDNIIGAEDSFSSLGTEEGVFNFSNSLNICEEDMDFWHDVYARAEEIMLEL